MIRGPSAQLGTQATAGVPLVVLAGARLGMTTGTAARESALGKIERVLPVALRVQAVRATLGCTLPERAPARHLLALGAAARSHRRVSLTYRSWHDAVTTLGRRLTALAAAKPVAPD
ncbi:hypothetical protein GCM10010399_94430 [Dactylosporangium fulvum]|uniref:Uncharacterized protein n=1 Tax=Dactylosporangium fulvum TaxID=53359 RepID=A0ABY5VQT1_9ACTN|nr:hypothetical protein [Dactylosporangium fulvum]UWP79479.1 hypothetical protein Dfulv_30470 [Dactylosporangium fulvum]